MEPDILTDLEGVGTRLFPSDVLSYFVGADSIQGKLLPEEAADIQHAVVLRQKEFTVGRILARRCMFELTGDSKWQDFPLKKGEKREPVWPELFCGSISHTKVLCGVAVGEKSRYSSLGLDIEHLERPGLNLEISRHVCTPGEIEYFSSLDEIEKKHYLLKIFSAKECIFKCIYPLTRKYFGFKTVLVTLDEKNESFSARLVQDIAGSYQKGMILEGRMVVEYSHVFAGMVA